MWRTERLSWPCAPGAPRATNAGRGWPLAALAALATVAGGCEVGIPAGSEPFYEFNWTDMANQPKLKPQRADLWGSPGEGMPRPPEGAVAVGAFVYPYRQDQADLAGMRMRNPLQPTPAVLATGQAVFGNFCQVCHGAAGAGDGPLTKKFPAPPHLMRQRVRDYSDGRIFNNPMRGQRSMPSYSRQLEPHEIWSAVLYLRKLQAGSPVAPPIPDDLKFWEEQRQAAAARAAADAAGAGSAEPGGIVDEAAPVDGQLPAVAPTQGGGTPPGGPAAPGGPASPPLPGSPPSSSLAPGTPGSASPAAVAPANPQAAAESTTATGAALGPARKTVTVTPATQPLPAPAPAPAARP